MQQPIKPMFMQTQDTLVRPNCRFAILSFVLTFVVLVAVTCLQNSHAQETVVAEEEKSERVVELEESLAACKAELAELQNPPPPVEDNEYIQNIDALQQRIEEATK